LGEQGMEASALKHTRELMMSCIGLRAQKTKKN
jgi:hypothetical protein